MAKADGSSQRQVQLPSPVNLSNLKPVYTLDAQDERANTLRRVLREGHESVAPLREPKLILHSHLPHVLSLNVATSKMDPYE